MMRESVRAAIAVFVAVFCSGVLLWTLGCKSLQTSTGQLNVPLLLTDVQFSVNAACSQQWLPPDLCTYATDGLTLAQAAVAKDPTAARPAVKQILIDVLAKLPPGNKLAPYFTWLIAIL